MMIDFFFNHHDWKKNSMFLTHRLPFFDWQLQQPFIINLLPLKADYIEWKLSDAGCRRKLMQELSSHSLDVVADCNFTYVCSVCGCVHHDANATIDTIS